MDFSSDNLRTEHGKGRLPRKVNGLLRYPMSVLNALQEDEFSSCERKPLRIHHFEDIKSF